MLNNVKNIKKIWTRALKYHINSDVIDGRVAQLVEQLTLNQWVRSSSLRAPTIGEIKKN